MCAICKRSLQSQTGHNNKSWQKPLAHNAILLGYFSPLLTKWQGHISFLLSLGQLSKCYGWDALGLSVHWEDALPSC